MNCPKCGYAMDAFDKECPRCHGKGIPQQLPITAQTQPTPTQTPTTLQPKSSKRTIGSAVVIVLGLLIAASLIQAAITQNRENNEMEATAEGVNPNINNQPQPATQPVVAPPVAAPPQTSPNLVPAPAPTQRVWRSMDEISADIERQNNEEAERKERERRADPHWVDKETAAIEQRVGDDARRRQQLQEDQRRNDVEQRQRDNFNRIGIR